MFRIQHLTEYGYGEPVDVANHLACLRPRELPHQHLVEFKLKISPTPATLAERVDYFGNTTHAFSIQSSHRRLVVESRSLVEVTTGGSTFNDAQMLSWEFAVDRIADGRNPDSLDAHQFVFESPRIPLRSALADYTLRSFRPLRPLREAVLDLTARIHREFEFRPAASNVSTTVDEVFQNRAGVCQDFAHLQIACLRSIRLAARYVSGYMRTTPPPGRERLVGADASHAWLSVFCPGGGWLDVDPTNNVVPDGDHITVAWGRDYNDVSPLRGLIIGGGAHVLNVSVDVEQVEESPEPALP